MSPDRTLQSRLSTETNRQASVGPPEPPSVSETDELPAPARPEDVEISTGTTPSETQSPEIEISLPPTSEAAASEDGSETDPSMSEDGAGEVSGPEPSQDTPGQSAADVTEGAIAFACCVSAAAMLVQPSLVLGATTLAVAGTLLSERRRMNRSDDHLGVPE